MACKFSFTFSHSENHKEVRFKSYDGIEYVVQFHSLLCRTNLKFDIHWNTDLSVVVKTKLFPDNKKKSIEVQGNQASFEFCNSTAYGMCVISIMPLLKLQSIHTSVASKSTDRGPVVINKNKIEEKKLERLSVDMQNLFLSGNLSDVVLSDGSIEFPAHKVLLSARSSVFAKMFQHSMKENRENRVMISDIHADVLKQLLYFIYTGIVCVKNDNMARDLYAAADKYDLVDLKDACSVYLKAVNLDSVLDTLIFADFYRDKPLKQSAMEFIANNFSLVEAHSSWENCIKENQELAIELLSFVVKKK